MNLDEINADYEVMDVTKISSSLPVAVSNEVSRENICYAISEMLKSETEVVVLDERSLHEGLDNLGGGSAVSPTRHRDRCPSKV